MTADLKKISHAATQRKANNIRCLRQADKQQKGLVFIAGDRGADSMQTNVKGISIVGFVLPSDKWNTEDRAA